MTTSRSDRKAASHDAIVRSAAQLLVEHGARGASVQRSMEGAGLTVGAFYAHFGDKTAMLSEAFGAAFDEAMRWLADAARTHPGAPFDAMVDLYLSDAHRDFGAGGCPLPANLADAAVGAGEISGEQLALAIQSVATLVTMSSGATREQSLAIVATMVGGLLLARAVRDVPALSSDILAACRSSVLDEVAPTAQ